MPLYLDEIHFKLTSKEDAKKVYDLINGAVTRGFPPGVTLKAGPWFSNEKPKVVLVAVMRKMLTTLNAMLRDDTPWARPSPRSAHRADRSIATALVDLAGSRP